jgi:hypothetical protein
VRVSDPPSVPWSPPSRFDPAPSASSPPQPAREFWKAPAAAAVVVGVAFSVLLMAVAFGVQARVDALVAHPSLPVSSRALPVHLIHQILLWLTIVVAGAMLLQTAISTFTMGTALMRSRRDEIAIRRQSGVLRITLLSEFARAMMLPCLLGGAVGEVLGVVAGLLLRSATVLPVRFTVVSTLSAFPLTVLLALAATLIPAWQSANASPALLRKE